MKSGGEGGIRTHVTIAREHAFQACSFSHSDTSPWLRAALASGAMLPDHNSDSRQPDQYSIGAERQCWSSVPPMNVAALHGVPGNRAT